MSVYLDLTRAFNAGRLRTILCSGQAVVLLRLAIASKDGDWVLREDQEALDHVLATLEARGAKYRFGAPLDLRWHRHGWSSHFEFHADGLRVRTDFFTRPPRVSAADLTNLWHEQEGKDPAFTGPATLVLIKQTAREKDWPIVGEIARLMTDPRQQILHSRSARDLIELAAQHPALIASHMAARPALGAIAQGLDALRMELERERFAAMDADAARIRRYLDAASTWEKEWPRVEERIAGLPLRAAHRIVVESAERCLPKDPFATGS